MQEEDPYLIPPDEDESDNSDQEEGPFLVRILACQPTATATTTNTASSNNGSILSPELQQHFETMQAMWLQERNPSNDPSNSSSDDIHPTIPHTTTTNNNSNNINNPSPTLRAQATETAMAMEQEIARWERQVQALEEQLLLASASHHSTASTATSHSQSAVQGGYPVSPAMVDRTEEHSTSKDAMFEG